MEDSDSRVQSISGKRKRNQYSAITANSDSVKSGQPTSKNGQRFAFSRPTLGAASKSHLNSQASSLPPGSDRPLLGHRERLRNTEQLLLKTRKSLPIWAKQEEIRKALRPNQSQVLILTGATGSGKSTQLPQFLFEEEWMRPIGHDGKKTKLKSGLYSAGCIAVTQPRRVAAVGLASRVSAEMGVRLGRSARGWDDDGTELSVGCSVRFDNNVSRTKNVNTVIKFLTEGVLLRELMDDPGLNRYSAVVVDEVHERSLDVDFILGFLRQILAGKSSRPANRPLRVIVMSATADVNTLYRFFAEGLSSANTLTPSTAQKDDVPISVCQVEGRLYPIKFTYLSQPSFDLFESCMDAIKKIHTHEGLPGDILVFLPGKDPIETLERLVIEYGTKLEKKYAKIMPLPLFAAMPSEAQNLVFEAAPPGTRRVILATNIAETSITVCGVRHVIDTGKAKVKKFHPTLGLSSLVAKPISQSSAVQRAGRAGREGPGTCYRLYTETDFKKLDPEPVPEILRSDLTNCLLGLKAMGIDDIYTFPFLSPPSNDAIRKGLIYILQLGALKPSDGTITPDGRLMSRLPLPPMLAKILVHAGTLFGPDVLSDAIDLVSALSTESVFIDPTSQDDREAASEARTRLLRRDGDHQTLVAVVQAYLEEQTDRKAWTRRHWVSHRAMKQVIDIRKQLIEQCASLGLGKITAGSKAESATDTTPSQLPALSSSSTTTASTASSSSFSSSSLPSPLVQCLLASFGTHTARLMPDRTYSTFIGNQKLLIHPSSVLFGRKVLPEAIVFTEHVYTSKSYARGVTMVQLDWMDAVFNRWEAITTAGKDGGD